MADLVTEIVPLHTIVASEATGVAAVGIPRGDRFLTLAARIQYWLASQASGSGTWVFTVSASYDKGNSWTVIATGATITLSATAQNGEQVLTFSTAIASDTGIDLVTVAATLGGAGVSPTVCFRADLIGQTQ